MGTSDIIASIDALIERLRAVPWKDREAVKDKLLALVQPHNSETLRQHLDGARKGLPLELRWEVEEVIEALTPPPTPPPAPEPEPEPEPPADGKLRMSDLKIVYEDPRGIVLFVDKSGKRWFLQQYHPQTGQPMMMELNPAEIEQVKGQLRGSPYWRIGSGVA